MAKQENIPNGRADIAFVMGEIASNGDAGVNKLIEAGLDSIGCNGQTGKYPRGTSKYCVCMSEIASNGDAGVNKLIEAGGIEALVKMAKQESTPNGRADIAFVMGEIAKIGAAEVWVGLRHWLQWPSRKI